VIAAPRGCGEPSAATSAARSVPASLSALVLDAASFSPAKASMAKTDDSASASATAMTTETAEAPAVPPLPRRPPAACRPRQVAARRLRLPLVAQLRVPRTLPQSDPGEQQSFGSAVPGGSGHHRQAGVHPGGTARYAIWVWPKGGAAGGVTVTVSGTVGGNNVTPAFTVCPAASGRTCTAGGIGGGTSDELAATIGVPGRTAAGEQAVLTASARASDAAASPGSLFPVVSPQQSASPDSVLLPGTPGYPRRGE
jgi:hypothetical protein